jgi:hypothetical protein
LYLGGGEVPPEPELNTEHAGTDWEHAYLISLYLDGGEVLTELELDTKEKSIESKKQMFLFT